MEKKKESFGFGRQWLGAVVKWKDYSRLMQVSGGKMVGFVALLLLLCFLVQYIFPLLVNGISGRGILSFQGAESLLQEAPEFSVQNGEFSIESPAYIDETSIFIYADDALEYFSLSDLQDFVTDTSYYYQRVLIVSRTNLVLYNNYQYQELHFSDLRDLNFRFDASFLKGVQVFLIFFMFLVLLIMFVFSFGWYFFCALLYSLFAMIFGAVLNGRFRFGQLYRAAIYAKAGPACLFALLDMIFHFCRNAGLSPEIPYRFWLRVLLTMALLFAGIHQAVKEQRATQSGGPQADNPYQPYGTQPFVPYGSGQTQAQQPAGGFPDATAGMPSPDGRISNDPSEQRGAVINGRPYEGEER